MSLILKRPWKSLSPSGQSVHGSPESLMRAWGRYCPLSDPQTGDRRAPAAPQTHGSSAEGYAHRGPVGAARSRNGDYANRALVGAEQVGRHVSDQRPRAARRDHDGHHGRQPVNGPILSGSRAPPEYFLRCAAAILAVRKPGFWRTATAHVRRCQVQRRPGRSAVAEQWGTPQRPAVGEDDGGTKDVNRLDGVQLQPDQVP